MTAADSLLSRLTNKALLPNSILVGGRWISPAVDGATFEVVNPSTGSVIAVLPDMGVAETRIAIDLAFAAQKSWEAKTGKERSNVFRKLFDLTTANVDDLGTILTAEMGKPLAEAKRIYGDVIPGHQPDKRILALKQAELMVSVDRRAKAKAQGPYRPGSCHDRYPAFA